jgi:hypothetical protein
MAFIVCFDNTLAVMINLYTSTLSIAGIVISLTVFSTYPGDLSIAFAAFTDILT